MDEFQSGLIKLLTICVYWFNYIANFPHLYSEILWQLISGHILLFLAC